MSSCSWLMMLQVRHIYEMEDGLLQHIQPNTYLIDSSTIDPNTTRLLYKLTQQKHSNDSDGSNSSSCFMIDAPVSGGVTGAASGSLTFMCGGDAAAVAFAKEKVLLSMGKNVIHCGGSGTGGVAKLCNNLALAVSMVSVCLYLLL